MTKRTFTLFALSLAISAVFFQTNASAQQKRVFMASDDHTDYFWSATGDEYRDRFISMLDYYLDQADATSGERSEFQSRFSADGSLWLWEYEKNKIPGDFQRLVDRIKSGHISAPMNPLVITYGGVPAEGVIRSMYYAGQLERRYGIDFPLAIAMENSGMPFGLGSLWAGSGAEYSWKGVCNCPSLIPNLNRRDNEIYRWIGADGSSILIKWNSLMDPNNNQTIGGYAEARDPAAALDLVTTNAASNGFAARYPYNTIGVFGQGWDDVMTTNLNIQQTCKTRSNSSRLCIVSNITDFFKEFQSLNAPSVPSVSASFGNEWDLSAASMSEVSARLKRALEKLRSAEALATLVSLKNPSFLNGREAARDKAFLNHGLYHEHDFENGGPGVAGSVRIAWQRQVAAEIESYTNTLMTDAASALGSMIQRSGSNPRFFVFNPLSWSRTDLADIPYGGPWPARVVDLSDGSEVPSQAVTVKGVQYLRVQVPNVPSVGYKVLEIQPGAGQSFGNGPIASAATGMMENEFYRIKVSPRGAITSFIDKRLGDREFAGTTGGFALNDLGAGTGTLQIENAGPVSVTLIATSGAPLAHVTRITLSRGSDEVEIQNEVTQNFGGTRLWRFSVNVTSPDLHHEEVGAVLRARLTSSGGNYSPTNARYDYLTLNHFADMSGAGSVGLTLSNADAYFMTLGASGITNLDTSTPQFSVVLGTSARPANPILNQAGDSYFLQRFALRSHGAYDQAASMRFSLEHQNPLTVGAVSGGSSYAESSFSYLSISDPNVFLWALKPAEEGIGEGIIARVWNLASSPTNFLLNLNEPIAAAKKTWHIETDQGNANVTSGVLNSQIAQNQILSFRLFPSSLPAAVKILSSDARVVETGDRGSFTVVRTGNTASSLDVPYTVGGTATPGTDYQTLSGVATIPAGAATVTVPVVPMSDNNSEPTESIVITLTPQPNYLLGSWSRTTLSLIHAATQTAPPSTVNIHFPFSTGSGATTADSSGSQFATLVNGAAWTTGGKYGSAISFDGADDHLSVPDDGSLDLGSSGTIEAWVKLNGLNRWQSVIAKGNANSDPGHNYALELTNANRWACILGNGGSAVFLQSTISPTTNQFIHVACTWNGTAVQLYVNGALNASTSQNLTPAGNGAPLYIGQFGGNADRLNGVIDEVRIYNKALTASEIQADMNKANAAPDTTPPAIIAGPNAANVTATGANITWTTDESSTSQVEYGLTATYGASTPLNPGMVTSHSEALSGLSSGTTYHYRVSSRDAAGNPVASSDATFTTAANPDTTRPTVGITSPASGATVSGIITVTAAASDNVAVAGVQFKLDGQNLGGEDTSSPYSTSWDSTTATNGTHLLSAAARDAAGNLGTSATVSVTVSNTTPPPPGAGSDDLRLSYAFQGASGTSAADGSGNGNSATLTNGAAWTTAGKYGNAVSFDGADDYLSVPDNASLDLGNTGTIEAWVKINALNRWHSVIAKGNANSNPAHNYALEVTSGNRWMCILGNGASAVILHSTVSPASGQFTHVACVWNGTAVQLYINGVLNASTAQGLIPAANTSPLYIGQFGGNADRLNGVIDEVRVYDKALTQPEIQSDMNTPQ